VRYIKLIIFIFCVGTITAQNYPIAINISVQPPYNAYVPDYFDVGSNKVGVTMTLKDLASPPIDVYLKVQIKGTGIQAVNNFSVPASLAGGYINLSPGVPTMISSSQIADYFKLNTLQLSGSDVDKITQDNAFTEGIYQICITAYERNRQVPLSAEACATFWVTTHNPPLLIFPPNTSSQNPLTPQLLTFRWNKLHTDFPGSLGSEYTFELFEVPQGRNPQEVALTMPPIYTEKSDLLTLTFDPSKPLLNLGTRYAWRVKVTDKSEKPFFKNKGYSEVWSFLYGDQERIITTDNTWKTNSDNIKITSGRIYFDSINNIASYKVEYRKKGSVTWYADNVANNSMNVSGLKSSTTYEYRVSTNTTDQVKTSAIKDFTTLPKGESKCGVDSVPTIDCSNRISFATPGSIWDYNGFELQVVRVTNNNGSYFDGIGYISIPFLAGLRIPVEFNTIGVNQNMVVCSGTAEAITKGLEAFIRDGWAAAGGGSFTGTLIRVDRPIKWIKVDFTKRPPIIVVTFPDGTTREYPFEFGKEYLFTDPNGNVWKVDGNGNVTDGKQGAATEVSPAALAILKKALQKMETFYTKSIADGYETVANDKRNIVNRTAIFTDLINSNTNVVNTNIASVTDVVKALINDANDAEQKYNHFKMLQVICLSNKREDHAKIAGKYIMRSRNQSAYI
jgi:hypothetical protein